MIVPVKHLRRLTSLGPTHRAVGARRFRLVGLYAFGLAISSGLWLDSARSQGAIDLTKAKARYGELVAEELNRQIVPGVSVAWIIDGKLVHAAGYGRSDSRSAVAASVDTIYRAGSISKLLNAVAAMQLVEQGKLDLDAPIQKALPEFRIVMPFEPATPITIRQLLCHRSGMVREAPRGGYLDPSHPSVAETLASVSSCALVNRPNTKTRYSNVGPTIVGRALEVQSGLSFAEYQQKYLLDPLGMQSSAWTMNDSLRPRLARGLMRVARGNGKFEFEVAPEFELGTIPAGNLYTTATDLARFAAFVMGSGSISDPSSRILNRASLEKMCTPQLTNEPIGFGLGFSIGRYRDHKTVQHMGAVYGFTTSIVVLPDLKIGVVLLSNADIATAPVRRLSDAALDLLLQAVRGETITPVPVPLELPTESLSEMAGEYESAGYWARLEVADHKLRGEFSSQPIELMPVAASRFLADGRIMLRSPFDFQRSPERRVIGFSAAGQRFERVDSAKVPQAPESWRQFAGKYGPSFIPLVISIRHGHLYALAENEYDYRLTPVDRVTFRLPPGMYEDEQIVFQTDLDGKVIGVLMANMYLPRRAD